MIPRPNRKTLASTVIALDRGRPGGLSAIEVRTPMEAISIPKAAQDLLESNTHGYRNV
jgi:hypothetical protein